MINSISSTSSGRPWPRSCMTSCWRVESQSRGRRLPLLDARRSARSRMRSRRRPAIRPINATHVPAAGSWAPPPLECQELTVAELRRLLCFSARPDLTLSLNDKEKRRLIFEVGRSTRSDRRGIGAWYSAGRNLRLTHFP